MHWDRITRVLAPAMLIAVISGPGFAQAQGAGGGRDLRARNTYSAEELAQALFPEAAGGDADPGYRPVPGAAIAAHPASFCDAECAFLPEF